MHVPWYTFQALELLASQLIGITSRKLSSLSENKVRYTNSLLAVELGIMDKDNMNLGSLDNG